MAVAVKRLMALLSLICVIGMCGAAHAQQSMKFRGSDGWGFGTRYEQLFDNYNLQTVIATVVRVDTATPMKDMGVAVRLIVTLDGSKDEMPVHLGPMWFALNQDVNFPKGEKIELKGCRTSYMGAEFIMPVEMRRKDRVFRFRDDDGNPFWCIYRNK